MKVGRAELSWAEQSCIIDIVPRQNHDHHHPHRYHNHDRPFPYHHLHNYSFRHHHHNYDHNYPFPYHHHHRHYKFMIGSTKRTWIIDAVLTVESALQTDLWVLDFGFQIVQWKLHHGLRISDFVRGSLDCKLRRSRCSGTKDRYRHIRKKLVGVIWHQQGRSERRDGSACRRRCKEKGSNKMKYIEGVKN